MEIWGRGRRKTNIMRQKQNNSKKGRRRRGGKKTDRERWVKEKERK